MLIFKSNQVKEKCLPLLLGQMTLTDPNLLLFLEHLLIIKRQVILTHPRIKIVSIMEAGSQLRKINLRLISFLMWQNLTMSSQT